METPPSQFSVKLDHINAICQQALQQDESVRRYVANPCPTRFDDQSNGSVFPGDHAGPFTEEPKREA